MTSMDCPRDGGSKKEAAEQGREWSVTDEAEGDRVQFSEERPRGAWGVV